MFTKLLILLGVLAAGALGFMMMAKLLGQNPLSDVLGPVPQPLVALHEHFERAGVPSKMGLVRRTHAQIRARVRFLVKSSSANFGVALCDPGVDVEAFRREIGGTVSHGRLILLLEGVPSDSPLRKTVLEAFKSFPLDAGSS